MIPLPYFFRHITPKKSGRGLCSLPGQSDIFAPPPSRLPGGSLSIGQSLPQRAGGPAVTAPLPAGTLLIPRRRSPPPSPNPHLLRLYQN